jgi:catechol 2,3-dioxygenase
MATDDVTTTIHPQTRIGHIHLTVADLHRSIAFYRDLLGFAVTMWFGDSAVFLSAGGYHHHIGLNTWASRGASPPPPGHTGLYHFAILYPNRHELAKVLKRLLDAHYPLQGTNDHGVSEAIYLADPDGNGVELYVDRPLETWPRDAEGRLKMSGRRALDMNTLLSVLDHEES